MAVVAPYWRESADLYVYMAVNHSRQLPEHSRDASPIVLPGMVEFTIQYKYGASL